ncbi:hypothetical protein FPZ43_00160 [Mucilaginibacter pallidiroseus]|uniref:Uncharacterized protein n=1 Tax=Mucilaginibacter pallidiroseus TaxID=2599295 RepID=A0A563UHW3_9SPHI|nr:hypothetical protein [Mucilaginibacter pallidiroseus]TWR30931.1 hypothetical protein FPZ43_00160 [Mucilaginibacter pallidiroseus]
MKHKRKIGDGSEVLNGPLVSESMEQGFTQEEQRAKQDKIKAQLAKNHPLQLPDKNRINDKR